MTADQLPTSQQKKVPEPDQFFLGGLANSIGNTMIQGGIMPHDPETSLNSQSYSYGEAVKTVLDKNHKKFPADEQGMEEMVEIFRAMAAFFNDQLERKDPLDIVTIANSAVRTHAHSLQTALPRPTEPVLPQQTFDDAALSFVLAVSARRGSPKDPNVRAQYMQAILDLAENFCQRAAQESQINSTLPKSGLGDIHAKLRGMFPDTPPCIEMARLSYMRLLSAIIVRARAMLQESSGKAVAKRAADVSETTVDDLREFDFL